MNNIKKKDVKRHSKLVLKRGTEAGKKVIKTKLIVIGIILLVITVGIVIVVQTVPWMLIVGGGGGGTYVPPDDPIIIVDPIDPVDLTPSAPVLNMILPNPDTDGTFALTWSISKGRDYYDVMMRKEGSNTWTQRKQQYGTTFTDILEDGVYYYKIIAKTNLGLQSESNIVNIVVQRILQIPPVIIVIPSTPALDPIIPNIVYDGVVVLTWATISNADSYKIYRSKDGGAYEIIKTVNTNSYTDKALEVGIYIYKIKAINIAGDSGISNIEAVKVDITQPTPTPVPTPTPTETDQTMVIIVLVIVVITVIPVIAVITILNRKK